MRTTISSKGPTVEPGQEFEAECIDRGDRLIRRNPPPNEGVLDWLLDCPAKGYFTPIESESTDTL